VPFLQAVERLRPLAVLLENVPDLAMNADGVILRRIFETFIKLDYHVTATTLPAHYFGVPQYRQRLFVVAFSSPVEFHWPNMHVKSDGSNVTLKDAIADLPPVEAGWNSVSPPYEGPITDLQMVLREGIPANQASTVWDHVTRAVRADDAEAFRLMDSRTSYQDLPAHLKRYDDENFTDKYNRLSWDQPSRAITAHLARDGYGYIHPDQHRTLTIREAARIQSFPDRFRFAGFPVSAFRQIGEAVAPLVAEGLAKEILSAVNKTKASRRKRSVLVSRANFAPGELKAWVAREPPKNSATPWRLTGSLWLIMMGEVLMSDLPVRTRQLFWNNLQIAWPTPGSYLKDQNRVYRMAAIKQREALKTLDQVAKLVLNNLSLQPEHLLFIGTRKAALAFALCGYAYARPDIASVARVAKRYFDFTETDDASDRQILIGLLIGEDVSGHAFAGLLEIGQRICSAKEPACLFCPLRPSCAFAKTRGLSRDHDDAGSSEILSATAVLDAEEWAERVEAH
jgi:DNA (cytosine-5)-methyltransferase 1